MRIVALTTCHNRRFLTLRALQAVQCQALLPGHSLQVCLVDDASSDGTGDAVRATFPSVVVLDGSGSLYWAGGMRFGWRNYVVDQDPDYLLVFNDDVELSKSAVSVLLTAAVNLESEGCVAYAVSGGFVDPETGKVAYGGAMRNCWWHPLRFAAITPTDKIQECDTLNMNLALISRAALRLVGFLASDFTHAMADYDFGLRLRAAGGRVALAPGYAGECSTNSLIGRSEQAGLSHRERWRRLTGVKEQPPAERAALYRRHGGWLWPLYFALPYLRVWLESAAGFLTKRLIPRRAK